MFKSYLIVAWRNLLKQRLFTLLNLAGLSTGLACTLMIYLWVHDELSVDHFHQQSSQLFTVMENKPHDKGIMTTAESPAQLAAVLKQEMPEVEQSVVTTPANWFPKVNLSAEDKQLKGAGLFAGAGYFNIFSYPLLSGDKAQVLADKGNIVISERLAMRLFNTTQNIIGKTVNWQIDQFKRPALIAGVFKDMPGNASVKFDFILPFTAFRELMNIGDNLEPGGPFSTYLVLKKGTDVSGFNAKLTSFMQQRSGMKARTSFVTPYADNYLYGTYENGVQSGGRISYVKLFSLIAVFIIIIACINFMNLATAKATSRIKEVGVRKAIGAGRFTLVLQYLGESMLLSLLALLLATGMVLLLLGPFNAITGKQLVLRPTMGLIAAFVGITFFTGLLAGSYPAFYLSGFRPALVLKGKINNRTGALWARKGLVVFQFAVSVIFIVAVLVVYRQLNYVQNRQLGFQKDHVIYFDAEGRVPESMEAFLSELRSMPGVLKASSMVGNVFRQGGQPINWKWKDHNETIIFRPFLMANGMLEVLGITMKEGRGFSGNYAADTSKIILNETAVAAMGLTHPVGMIIPFGGQMREVAGVVKDFNFQSLHEKVQPLFFQMEPRGGTVMVKIQAGMEQAVTARLEQFYRSFNPGYAFEYSFLDNDYQTLYTAEKRVGRLSGYFSGLAILISCLGLFGLAAYTAESRRKEIGIRKVLGAGMGQVVLLLSADLLRSVALAVGIALPVAWLVMRHWLDNFAYQVPFGWDILLIAGAATMLITFLTISMQTIKAAFTNPVSALKME